MQIRNILSSLLHRFRRWVYYGDAAPHVDACQHFIDAGIRPSNACPKAYPLTPAGDPLEALGDRLASTLHLHQRVVEELRREYYAIGGLGMPGHLAVLKDSGFPLHCDIYEREIERWRTDVAWCADRFGVDRMEFLRTCSNTDELRDEQPKRTFGTFIAPVGPDYKGLKPD